MERLQRINNKLDLIVHVEKEMRYLREKVERILKERESKLI